MIARSHAQNDKRPCASPHGLMAPGVSRDCPMTDPTRDAAYSILHAVLAKGAPLDAALDRLPRLDVARALAAVELPLHLNWSAPGRVFDLRSRADRARAYEIVLQEGTPADILAYVDGVLLVDLWEDLVLSRSVRSAWAPLISVSIEAEP